MSRVAALLRHPDFRAGARDMAPVAVGIAAWGLVTGVAMAQSGLSLPLAVFMSLAVYAGSAQLAALPLIAAGAPMPIVWATAFCVNLRFLIFSAHWRPYFMRYTRGERLLLGYLAADLSYVVFMKRYPRPDGQAGQLEYFLGGALLVWFAWQLPSIAGIVLADAVPTQWGLGFAGVLALIGLLCSLLNDRATVVSAAVAVGAAIAAFALPLKLHIVVAIAAAVCAGLVMERAGRSRDAAEAPGEEGAA